MFQEYILSFPSYDINCNVSCLTMSIACTPFISPSDSYPRSTCQLYNIIEMLTVPMETCKHYHIAWKGPSLDTD